MVSRGIRGAVIALVCGSAVATAMGVLSRNAPIGWDAFRKDVSQRVRYQIDSAGSAYFPPAVRTAREYQGSAAGVIGLPEFMTSDTARPTGGSAGAIAAARNIHLFEAGTQRSHAPLVQNDFSAAVRGGSGGGFAYAFTSKFDAEGGDLSVDLARPQGALIGKTYGSDTPFSGNPAPRGGSDFADALRPFSGPDNPAELPQTLPGETNAPAATNNALVGPATGAGSQVIPNGVPVNGGAIWDDGAPAPSNASTAVPAPGAAGLLGLAGLAVLRRRR